MKRLADTGSLAPMSLIAVTVTLRISHELVSGGKSRVILSVVGDIDPDSTAMDLWYDSVVLVLLTLTL